MSGIKSTPLRKSVTTPTAETKVEQPQKPVAKENKAIKTALVELPLGDVAQSEYLSTHVEARLKTREQQLTMKRLNRGLQALGAKTKDGRPVLRPGDVIRFLMERIVAEN